MAAIDYNETKDKALRKAKADADSKSDYKPTHKEPKLGDIVKSEDGVIEPCLQNIE